MKLSPGSLRTPALAICCGLVSACALEDQNLSGPVAEPASASPVRPPVNPTPYPPPPPTPMPPPPLAPAPTSGGPGGPASTPPPTPGTTDPVPPPAAPGFSLVEVATWRGGAAAAYSLVHDSVCDRSAEGNFQHADPELMRRGLHGTFGVIVGSCEQGPGNNKWARVKALATHGHELVNHSFSHACLGSPMGCAGVRRSEDFAQEIDRAAQLLQDNTGQIVRYFDFPFDTCGTEAVAHLRQRGYLGARCGGRGVSPADIPDGFETRYDVWGPSYSMYRDRGPCQGVVQPLANTPPDVLPAACRSFVLDQYVEDAIAAKGWATRTLTGFSDDMNAFQPISLADYTAHLDFLKAKVDQGQLWVDGPAAILTYRFAREKCPPPTVEGNTLHFAAPGPDCQKHATTLSYVVSATTMPAPATLTVTQGHSNTPARTLAPGRYLVDADPTLGDAELTP